MRKGGRREGRPAFLVAASAAALSAAILVLSFTSLAQEKAMPGQPTGNCPEVELLVKFMPGADPFVVSARHGARIVSTISGIDVHVLAVPAGSVDEKIAAFQADPDVEFAEANSVMSTPEQPVPESGTCAPPP